MSTSQPKESELADKARTLNCSSSNPIVLGLDLAFTDQALENEFIKQHNRSQVFYDACCQFLACCSATNTTLALLDRSGLPRQRLYSSYNFANIMTICIHAQEVAAMKPWCLVQRH
ncbi:hypothetical protein NADE_005341 [Nannochloris sp. 'desiccata']|nr:hypothetical protein NADE_003990 [Chlorella desiccata (nom. nud.)]KAH7617585.1 hypothetical protein NADE_003992 [Chlorella desiccata (nom. nud.)]KAH7622762.1 hypothetical protein NADE_005341 [Chlorella desiccata (nom. nud.)]